jgi:putative FmdB family regulatory protein
MPVYTYRCLDCGLTLDVRHGMDETHNESCEGCEGVVRKYFGNIQFAPSATPSRSDIDLGATKRNEKNKDADMAAYKRLRSEGLQPRAINGSSHLEKHAGTSHEITAGQVLSKGGRKRKEAALNIVLGSN